MNLVVSISLLSGFNRWAGPDLAEVSLLFVAGQACLAYSTSGIAKLVSPVWRREDPLLGILATTAYGSPRSYRVLASLPSRWRQLSTLTVVLMESSFPVMLLGSKWVLVVYLCWGVVFHAVNAGVMGLNSFFWSFLATYPALCFTWLVLH